MTYSLVKVEDQQSVGSEDGNKRTDGQTDGGDCITAVANAVGNSRALHLMPCDTYCATVGVGVKVQQYYSQFVNSGNIKTEFNLSFPHTFVRTVRYDVALIHARHSALHLYCLWL